MTTCALPPPVGSNSNRWNRAKSGSLVANESMPGAGHQTAASMRTTSVVAAPGATLAANGAITVNPLGTTNDAGSSVSSAVPVLEIVSVRIAASPFFTGENRSMPPRLSVSPPAFTRSFGAGGTTAALSASVKVLLAGSPVANERAPE